jgi:hypothetical protein
MKWKNTFRVGIFKCELSYSERGGLHAWWSPDMPDRKLSDQEMAQYRSGRDNLLAEVGKAMGRSVAVIECGEGFRRGDGG